MAVREVSLSSEPQRPTPNLSRGERFNERGVLEANLPASGAPCGCERDTKGRAAEDCLKCEGSGFHVYRRPRDVEPVDANDDGLLSYEAALALRDQGGMRTDRLGASPEELMSHPIAHRTSSGSGKRRVAQPKAGAPHPKTANDGREELHEDVRVRRGRPPKYCELGTNIPTPRTVKSCLTVTPATLAGLLAANMALADLSEAILAKHSGGMKKAGIAAPADAPGLRIPCVLYTTSAKRAMLRSVAALYSESVGRLFDRMAPRAN